MTTTDRSTDNQRDEAVGLEHPNSRYLFKQMCARVGINLGVDNVGVALEKIELAFRAARQSPQAESPYDRNPNEGPCKCGLKVVPRGCDGVNWYWQRHGRDACTLELPNERCWCGLLRSEHLTGHADKPQAESSGGSGAVPSTEPLTKPANGPEVAPWIDAEWKLPCEVRLPNGMTIGKGVHLHTLLTALKRRQTEYANDPHMLTFSEPHHRQAPAEGMAQPLFVIFDGPPSHESGRFVEVETADGRSVGMGTTEWKELPGGLWSLGPFYEAAPSPPAAKAEPSAEAVRLLKGARGKLAIAVGGDRLQTRDLLKQIDAYLAALDSRKGEGRT